MIIVHRDDIQIESYTWGFSHWLPGNIYWKAMFIASLFTLATWSSNTKYNCFFLRRNLVLQVDISRFVTLSSITFKDLNRLDCWMSFTAIYLIKILGLKGYLL